MLFDYETNTLHIKLDEIEPLFRSMGRDVWPKYCRDVMDAFEKLLKEGDIPCKS